MFPFIRFRKTVSVLPFRIAVAVSGAGTKLKVEDAVPAQKWGAPIRHEVLENLILGCAPPLF